MIKSYINATWPEYVDEETSIEHTLEGVYVASNRDLGLPELEVEHQQPMTSFAGVKGFYYRFESEEQMLELVPELQPVEIEEMPEQVEPEPAPYDLEAGKATAKAMLHKKCEKLLEELAIKYPKREPDTWTYQVMEAKSYLADNSVETPFINNALLSDETVEWYANVVLANNAVWSPLAGAVVGFRRAQEINIESAETKQDIEKIMGGIYVKSN